MVLPENNSGAVLKTRLLRIVSSPVFICLLLAAMTLGVYWPATRCDFLNYDDPAYFTSNPHILSGLNSGSLAWAFTTGYAGNWHPLTWLSLMLDAQVFGNDSFGPHFTNLLFHAANTALLFLLLRKLTAAVWRSAFVTALFALHPLHIESVAWVAERKDVLSTLFALLALLSYADFAKENHRRHFWLALIFFALGLMAKPMLVTLPFVMLLLDFWPLQRISNHGFQIQNLRPLFLEKIPFFTLSAISCAVTFAVQQKSGAVATLQNISMPGRIENVFVSYARYLGKTIWPDPLANPYPYPGHWELPLVVCCATLIIGLSAIAILFARKFPFVFTGWFWFVGTLVPVIGLVQVGIQSMADRYTYFPLIGVFIIFIWGMGMACASFHLPRLLIVFSAMIVLTACTLRTRDQLGYWRDNETLFSHTLAVTGDNYTAYINLGTWMSKHGHFAEAMDLFHDAQRMNPADPDVLYNLGNVLSKTGKWDKAVENYRLALQIKPDQPDVLDNLGFALAAKKDFAGAITSFQSALKLDPDYADAHNNLATVYFMEQKYYEAEKHFREAIRISPDNPQFYANLADALTRQNKISEAVQNYQTALRLNPGDARTRSKLQALGAPISN